MGSIDFVIFSNFELLNFFGLNFIDVCAWPRTRLEELVLDELVVVLVDLVDFHLYAYMYIYVRYMKFAIAFGPERVGSWFALCHNFGLQLQF